MMRLKIRGSRAALNDPRVQWEINRQLLQQQGERIRQISAGNVHGEIIFDRDDTAAQAVELIKARAQGPALRGEIDVIREVREEMSATHARRVDRLRSDLMAILDVDDDDLTKGSSSSYPREWFKPPQAVADEAERGLKLRRKYRRGGLSTQEAGRQGIGSGVQRASDLKNREYMSPRSIKRMIAFFARHRKNKSGKNDRGEPSAGAIAWLLWGGDAGEKWALRVRDRMERHDASR